MLVLGSFLSALGLVAEQDIKIKAVDECHKNDFEIEKRRVLCYQKHV